MNRRRMLARLGGAASCGAFLSIEPELFAAEGSQKEAPMEEEKDEKLLDPLPKSNAEWRRILTREQYRILRRKGTERAFTGDYWNTKGNGVYRCGGCGQKLFSSEHKFDSGTGWPSYWQPIDVQKIGTRPDNTLFTRRTEVICGRCEGHLGHVFTDGPQPTGLRYCINSAALKFDPQEEEKGEKDEKPSKD